MKVVAYLSHARIDGKLSVPAKAIVEKFKLSGGELINDSDNVKLEVPVGSFMSRLKSANVVIFLLNERFFESLWCVSELTEFIEHTFRPRLHAVFVRTDGWLANQTGLDAYLRTEFSQIQMLYWKSHAESTVDKKHKLISGEITKNIEHSLELISTSQLIELSLDSPGSGDAVLEQIYRQSHNLIERQNQSIEPFSHEKFRQACETRLSSFFRLNSSVVPNLILDFADVLELDDEKMSYRDVAAGLMKLGTEDRLTKCRRAIENLCIHDYHDWKKTIAILTELVGLVLISLVEELPQDELENSHEREFYTIVDKDEFAASIIVARLQNTPGSDLNYEKRAFVGVGQYDPVGPAEDQPDVVTAQISVVWQYEFPDEKMIDGQESVDRLWRKMRENFQDGKPRYLVIPHGHKLDDVHLLYDLKAALPFLFIFKVGVEDSRLRMFSPDLRGLNIKDTLDRFCTIINKLERPS